MDSEEISNHGVKQTKHNSDGKKPKPNISNPSAKRVQKRIPPNVSNLDELSVEEIETLAMGLIENLPVEFKKELIKQLMVPEDQTNIQNQREIFDDTKQEYEEQMDKNTSDSTDRSEMVEETLDFLKIGQNSEMEEAEESQIQEIQNQDEGSQTQNEQPQNGQENTVMPPPDSQQYPAMPPQYAQQYPPTPPQYTQQYPPTPPQNYQQNPAMQPQNCQQYLAILPQNAQQYFVILPQNYQQNPAMQPQNDQQQEITRLLLQLLMEERERSQKRHKTSSKRKGGKEKNQSIGSTLWNGVCGIFKFLLKQVSKDTSKQLVGKAMKKAFD